MTGRVGGRSKPGENRVTALVHERPSVESDSPDAGSEKRPVTLYGASDIRFRYPNVS